MKDNLNTEKDGKYQGYDLLRVIACIGILVMHIGSPINNSFEISGYFFNKIIPSFVDFVFVFMALSAFGLLCGYYKRFIDKTIDFSEFYIKRYKRILPFFAILVFIDLLVDFSVNKMFEAIADISLTFGLFSNSISVVGVGWFLGLTFAFYFTFPFFCTLLQNPKRFYLVFLFSLLLNYVTGVYFQQGAFNIVYSYCYFMLGGLVFLCKDVIVSTPKTIRWLALIGALVLYLLVGRNTFTRMLLTFTILCVFIDINIKIAYMNKTVRVVNKLSMEIYLSHLAVFRIFEKIKINTLLGNGIVQYVFLCITVFFGSIIFSYVINLFLEIAEKLCFRIIKED